MYAPANVSTVERETEDDGSVLAEHVPAPTLSSRKRIEELKEIERGIVAAGLQVVAYTLDFQSIDADAVAPPQEWVRQMGEEAAWRRFRVAKEGWKSAKEAAVGIKVAAQIASAGIKASAVKQVLGSLNIAFIGVTAPASAPAQYEEVLVDGHDG